VEAVDDFSFPRRRESRKTLHCFLKTPPLNKRGREATFNLQVGSSPLSLREGGEDILRCEGEKQKGKSGFCFEKKWIPAFAVMTTEGAGMTQKDDNNKDNKNARSKKKSFFSCK